MRQRTLFLFFLAAGLAAAPRAGTAPSEAPPNSAAITQARLREYVAYLAADERGGRGTPSPGLDEAARYLAGHVKDAGLEPAGDEGGFFQRIQLRRDQLDLRQTQAQVGSQVFRCGEGFLASPPGGSVEGPLVYVGHGWSVKGKVDAYQGVDVEDRIMVAFQPPGGLPRGVREEDLNQLSPADWDTPLSYARKHEAKGIIWVPDPGQLERWRRESQALGEESVVVERLQSQPGTGRPIPAITASPAMMRALFQGEKFSGPEICARASIGHSGSAFELRPDKRASFTVTVVSGSQTTQNVVATYEGSDPDLKREYVALGAHYDHLGTGKAVNGDRIYNGADDNASGCAAVLSIAEAFARAASDLPRPKRSLLFIWFAGEERGMWGSQYFTTFPTVPLRQIAAQLNVDMIGRSRAANDRNPENQQLTGPNELYVVGSKVMSDDLGSLSESVNRSFLDLTFNYRYDNPRDPNRLFFRSDHYNFAKKGIPVIFYFSGLHEHYHHPDDEADRLDYEKAEKVTRTIYATAWALANAPHRPRVVRDLPRDLANH